MSDFPAKYSKKLPTGFSDKVEGLTTEEIKKEILLAEEHIYEVDKAKDEDEKLKQVKEMAKEIAEPYAESKGIESAKIKYCLFMLASRGVSI